MKEPKYQKLENMPKDNKYDFFAEGIFPEEIEEKKRLNKNRSSKKGSKYPKRRRRLSSFFRQKLPPIK